MMSAVLWGPDGTPMKVVIPDIDLPHARKVDRSTVQGWPDVEAEGDCKTMVALRVPPKVGGMYGRDGEDLVDLEPLQDRHITVLYLGKQPPQERDRLHGAVRNWMAESEWPPLKGDCQGWGTFTPSAVEKRNVLWMGWNIPGLNEMRHDLAQTLRDDGFQWEDDFDFTPHETIGYTDDPIGQLPVFPQQPVNHTFDGLTVAEDDDWTEYPFNQGLVYASGRPAIVAALEAAIDDELAAMSDNDLEALIAAGGADRNRGNAEKLRRYWTVGKGGAKIRWGTKGAWTRCVRHLSKYMGPRAKGYCQLRKKEMTGNYTGDMAERIKHGWGGKPGSYWARVASQGTLVSLQADGGGLPGAEELLLRMQPATPSAPQAFRIPLLLPEGVESGDGRTFEAGVVEVRDTPIPLLWQPNSMQGHDGAMIVGRIDHVERVSDGIGNASGVFDTSPVAQEAVRMIRDGFLRGVSADLDKFEAKILGKGSGTAVAGEASKDGAKKKDDDVVAPDKMAIRQGRIMAATLVAKPAFDQARIELMDSEIGEAVVPMEDEDGAVVASAGTTLPDGVYRGTLGGELRADAARFAAKEVQRVKFTADMAQFSRRDTMLASAGVPIMPPSDWFRDPGLTKPTHLSITDDGRVFGHIAAWHVDHIGMGFGTKPPKSRTNYAYFRTGLLRTVEGDDVRVGQITLSGGHAGLSADARTAVAHYDDTQSAFADVVAGEDRYGIWVAGALRPEVSELQLRAARASSPSGDWRPINGRLELVAVCQVNVPGFPVVEARVAGGMVVALVAAGTTPLVADLVSGADVVAPRRPSIREAAALLASRDLEASAVSARDRMSVLVASAVPVDWDARASSVRDRMSGLTASAPTPGRGLTIREAAALLFASREVDEGGSLVAAARHALPDGSFRVADVDGLKRAIEEFGSCGEGERGKVKRHIKRRALSLGAEELLPVWWRDDAAVLSDSSPAEAALSKQPVSAARRKEMAKRREALPDGSFPISDVADLKRAISASGRANESDRKKVHDHIARRARALGEADLIPAGWR